MVSATPIQAAEAGRRFVAVDPKYTSQICSQCGFKHPDNRKTQADFACLLCGYQDNADHNAAVNISARNEPLSRWEKAWKRRICDEIVKPLKGIQRVKGPPWSCGVQCRGGVSLIRAFVLNLRTGSVMRREKAQARVPRGRKYRRDDQGRTAL